MHLCVCAVRIASSTTERGVEGANLRVELADYQGKKRERWFSCGLWSFFVVHAVPFFMVESFESF